MVGNRKHKVLGLMINR